jgi:hypothetical protein
MIKIKNYGLVNTNHQWSFWAFSEESRVLYRSEGYNTREACIHARREFSANLEIPNHIGTSNNEESGL